jgi:hypothetical protein
MLKKSNELDGVLKLKRLLFWEGLSYAVTGRVLTPPTPPVTSPSPRCRGLPPVMMAFVAPNSAPPLRCQASPRPGAGRADVQGSRLALKSFRLRKE